MIKYPNGQIYKKENKINKKTIISASNRGMNLEEDINISNEYYINENIALITKRPTPINVVKVDYSRGARIIDAYFEKQSTTDYNGVYKGRYIDFEAKNTKNRASFPLSNIYPHQINHLKKVIEHDGIAFFIVEFQTLEKIYLLDASYVINFYENGDRKSIPLQCFIDNGIEVEIGYNPRLDYIKAVDEKYFKS